MSVCEPAALAAVPLSPGRHRARRWPTPAQWRRYGRACAAVALGGGGVVAGVCGFVAATWGQTVVALQLATLSALLLGGSAWLALDPGEAWQRLTQTHPLNSTEKKTHV